MTDTEAKTPTDALITLLESADGRGIVDETEFAAAGGSDAE